MSLFMQTHVEALCKYQVKARDSKTEILCLQTDLSCESA